jgi:HAAS domain-containing protein
MTAPHADQLIDGYFARLRAASAELPRSAREELLVDMQSHIAEARARESEETDATILNILDRLGEPQTVVAEARDRLGLRSEPRYRPGLLEISAVVLLPFIWIVGVILLWWSPAWKVRDKIIGTLLVPGGYPALLIFALMPAGGVGSGGACVQVTDQAGNPLHADCSSFPPPGSIDSVLVVLATILFYILPLIGPLYLVARARWRPQQEQALA